MREFAPTVGRYDDVRMLIEARVPDEQIPGKVGVKAVTLSKWLRRHGHIEESRRIDRVAWHERKTCGRPTTKG